MSDDDVEFDDVSDTSPKKTHTARPKLKDLIIDEDSKIKKKTNKKLLKKGPGRPRKVPRKEPIPREGIALHPTDSKYITEFVYDSPTWIKKITNFFKSLAVAQIEIIFRPKDIIFYALDHHKKTKIYVCIDASKINHYHCKETLNIGLNASDLERTLNKVDKEYNSIIIIAEENRKQEQLMVVFDNDIQIDEKHLITLIGKYNHMDNETEFTDENYTISFEWPSKYFRKTINDIKTISTELAFVQKDYESNMSIDYISTNKKIHSTHTVKNPQKIKFKSQLKRNEDFRISVNVDYIKPIASAHIADEITIFIDEKKKFMTRAYIDDKTIVIKTITDIIDKRPDE